MFITYKKNDYIYMYGITYRALRRTSIQQRSALAAYKLLKVLVKREMETGLVLEHKEGDNTYLITKSYEVWTRVRKLLKK